MGTESYAAMMGQTLDAYVSFQQALRDSMNRYLETMNLPSRDDFTRLAAQVVALENKVDAIDEKLDGLQDSLGGGAGKLEALQASLDTQAKQLGELLTAVEARDSNLEAVLERIESNARRSTRVGEAGTVPTRRGQR